MPERNTTFKRQLLLIGLACGFIAVAVSLKLRLAEPVHEPNTDLAVILERDLVLHGQTVDDLNRFRRENHEQFQPPVDLDLASGILDDCELLWTDLQQFMHEPEFRKIRFAEGSKYADWKQRADNLHAGLPPKEIIGTAVSKLPAWIIAVANDYAGNPFPPGRISDVENWFRGHHLPTARATIEAAKRERDEQIGNE